jgi:hypothetical protein
MIASCNSSGTLILMLILSLRSSFEGPRDPSLWVFRIVNFMIFLVLVISNRRLRASALPLSFLGVYTILNLYCSKVSDYLTCRQFRVLVVVKLTKFLWSENTVRSEQLSA